MNNKVSSFIKNFSYTLISNLLTVLIATLVILIVPKLIGVEEYGYWQLYLFYSTYIGFMHFGWNDGIYLRYGGKHYHELDKKIFFSQFHLLVILQFLIMIAIYIYSIFFIKEMDKIFIVRMTALGLLIVNSRDMLIFILQGTNRIKEYAKITVTGRILYILLVIILLLLGIKDYKLMIVADLIGSFISLAYGMYFCKDIVFNKILHFRFDFKETFKNISVGSKLMFSNIASMLIMGVARFGIEHSWGVSTFGKISLILSISALMMILVNAIGIIMFPILRRTNKDGLSSIYKIMKEFLMVILLGALIMYYPIKLSLSNWLPKYAESFMYMVLLFPISIYESKMIVLINTYLKTLRKERLMLKINLMSLSLSIVMTIITTQIIKDLNLTILSILIVLIFRSIISEILLSKILKISLYKDILLEIFVVAIFILTGLVTNSWITVILYGIVYALYLFVKKNDIVDAMKKIKLLVKVE